MAFWQRTAHAPRAQRHIPIWPFVVAFLVLAAGGILYGIGAFAGNGPAVSPQAQAQSQLPTANENPVPQVKLQRHPQLTQVQKTVLQQRVDRGQATVISNEPEFLPLRVGAADRTSRMRKDMNAVAMGVYYLKTVNKYQPNRATPQVAEQIDRWRTKQQSRAPTLYIEYTPLDITTREFLPGTSEDITYHARFIDTPKVLGQQDVTLSFTSDGDKIQIIGFEPHK